MSKLMKITIALLIVLAGVIVFGCAASDQRQEVPQRSEQTSDKIGPLTAKPININIAESKGAITVTVTSTNTQQGSTEQAAEQVLTTGATTATTTQTTDADVEVTVPVSAIPGSP